LADGEKLYPIQEVFAGAGRMHVIFSTSGIILSARFLLEKDPNLTKKEIREEVMDGKILRKRSGRR